MGYRCPVCDAPQRDAGHLADHLAFTAMLRGEDHEEWLDERVPEWGDLGTETLADRVAGYAPETEFEAVFEDTTGGPHAHAHDHGRDPTHAIDRGRPDVNVDAAAASGNSAAGAGDAELQSVLHEAREMTREMLDGADDAEGDAGADTDSDGDADDASATGADASDGDGEEKES